MQKIVRYIFIAFLLVFAAKNSAQTSKFETGIKNRAIRIGVMLPLHDVDGDGKRMTEYYRGLLLACDSLKYEGISTDIHAWNVPIDADIRETLLDPAAKKCDIIFGPLYTKQAKYLADFCQENDIKLVIPFSINGGDVQRCSNVFQVYQPVEDMTERSINAFMQRFKNYHAIFIDCNDSTSNKWRFTSGLRKRLDAEGKVYNITNLKSSEENFSKAFSAIEPNIVILNTGHSPQLNLALAKMNSIKAIRPQVSISMFGYTEWLIYTKVYLDYYHKYETYIPSTFYYNPLSKRTQQLERNYRYWFHTDMMLAQPRFAITGFDHGQYFLRGLYNYGKRFIGATWQNKYQPIQTGLKFKQVGNAGYMNATFMLVHYRNDGGIDAINY